MMETSPRRRNLFRLALLAGCLLPFALAGCKSKDGGGIRRDPLVSGPRIPPQNVPVPGRDASATKGPKGDPLLERPVSRDKSGVGYSDDPQRFKGTYIPGPGSTPAALAGFKDGQELKIDDHPDNRVPLKRVEGEVRPAGGFDRDDALQPLYAELQKYGANRTDSSLVQENGQYVFRASVPISGNGAKRQYEGLGATANDAVKQVLDQVIGDRK
ncbi:MAG TPA: hypothetical protein VLM40_01440 [Gemmata sp.]|nr:hypothetical protein [Gemmata sp.]